VVETKIQRFADLKVPFLATDADQFWAPILNCCSPSYALQNCPNWPSNRWTVLERPFISGDKRVRGRMQHAAFYRTVTCGCVCTRLLCAAASSLRSDPAFPARMLQARHVGGVCAHACCALQHRRSDLTLRSLPACCRPVMSGA
jgi:hypothetical protein